MSMFWNFFWPGKKDPAPEIIEEEPPVPSYDMNEPFVFYKILGIPRHSTTREIEAAFRTCYETWDPQKWKLKRNEVERLRAQLIRAREVLSNGIKKDVYDFYYGSEFIFCDIDYEAPATPIEFMDDNSSDLSEEARSESEIVCKRTSNDVEDSRTNNENKSTTFFVEPKSGDVVKEDSQLKEDKNEQQYCKECPNLNKKCQMHLDEQRSEESKSLQDVEEYERSQGLKAFNKSSDLKESDTTENFNELIEIYDEGNSRYFFVDINPCEKDGSLGENEMMQDFNDSELSTVCLEDSEDGDAIVKIESDETIDFTKEDYGTDSIQDNDDNEFASK